MFEEWPQVLWKFSQIGDIMGDPMGDPMGEPMGKSMGDLMIDPMVDPMGDQNVGRLLRTTDWEHGLVLTSTRKPCESNVHS